MAAVAKARVAQLTSFRSIPAAAEGLVTFGCFFYRWKARLWVRWGSSCATGDGGRLIAAPTAENGPKALVRPSQAQLWNRMGLEFLQTQGPVARKKSQKATQILRAGNILPDPRGNPRNGGPGGGRHGGRGGNAVSADCAHSLAALWFLSARAERNSPPGRRNSPCK